MNTVMEIVTGAFHNSYSGRPSIRPFNHPSIQKSTLRRISSVELLSALNALHYASFDATEAGEAHYANERLWVGAPTAR